MALHGLDRPDPDHAAFMATNRGTYVRPNMVASRPGYLGHAWSCRLLPVFLPGMRVFAVKNRGQVLEYLPSMARQEMLLLRARSYRRMTITRAANALFKVDAGGTE